MPTDRFLVQFIITSPSVEVYLTERALLDRAEIVKEEFSCVEEGQSSKSLSKYRDFSHEPEHYKP
jgi:hypothetical protein